MPGFALEVAYVQSVPQQALRVLNIQARQVITQAMSDQDPACSNVHIVHMASKIMLVESINAIPGAFGLQYWS